MAKWTGFAKILRLFYLLGRPFFYLFLFAIYGLLVLGTLVRKIFSLFIKFVLLAISGPRNLILWLFRHIQKILHSLYGHTTTLLRSGKSLLKPKVPSLKVKPLKIRLRIPAIKFKVTPKVLAFLIGIIPTLFLIFNFYSLILKDLPSPQGLSKPLPLTTKIYDRNGKLLYKFFREQDRTKVKLEQIPLYVRQATIAIEDKNFYFHKGFSLRGIARALYYLIFEGKITGGSTITQQLVKNSLLSPEKTLKRKIKELILAALVEQKYSKDEILEMYLNEVGYGGSAYGIEEASQKYFGKSVKDLSLAQATLLAGLPASPTKYSPFGAHPEIAKIRQTSVLQRMKEDGYITEDILKEALGEPLKFNKQETEIFAPHFVMYVKEILAAKYGERMVEEGGLEVTTSLDLETQEIAQEIVKEEIEKIKPLRISNGAALVTDPRTGEILAMIGSKDYFAQEIDGNFNVTTALRQPGSSIKPVNYSLALEKGFTPATIISDTPITYQIPNQPPYSPKNYDNRFHGNIPLRIALGSSYNVPAVKVLAAFGVSEMVKRGQQMGITSWNDPSRFGLSLTLGGGEVKMTEMAVVYGTLANLGKKVNLRPILEIKDSSGKKLEEDPCEQEYLGFLGVKAAETKSCSVQILDPNVAWLLTNILSDNWARTPAFGPNSQLVIPGHEVAVKTGTTQNMRDNWTIGYTPSFLVATWVGNNDNTPMSYVASGVTGASPIWNKIMKELLKNKPNEPFEKPENVISTQICSLTNTLTCDGCPNPRNEYFIKGSEPKTHCSSEQVKKILEEKAKQEEEQKRQEKPE